MNWLPCSKLLSKSQTQSQISPKLSIINIVQGAADKMNFEAIFVILYECTHGFMGFIRKVHFCRNVRDCYHKQGYMKYLNCEGKIFVQVTIRKSGKDKNEATASLRDFYIWSLLDKRFFLKFSAFSTALKKFLCNLLFHLLIFSWWCCLFIKWHMPLVS